MARCRCRCNREPRQGLVEMPGVEPPKGVDLVPDDTTDAELAEMRAAGKLAYRFADAFEGPQDFDG